MKKVLVYDLHASESGALSILMDFYEDTAGKKDENVLWHFIVSIPLLKSTSNIICSCFPWAKKNILYRFFFERIYSKKVISDIAPDVLLSLQNSGVSGFKGKQIVYLHQALVLSDYPFKIRRDGIRLCLYRHISKFLILGSYKYVDFVIVQTQWMKDALSDKSGLSLDKIKIVYPRISDKNIIRYEDNKKNRKVFFFPATPFVYKNHELILEACRLLKKRGLEQFKVIFTLNSHKNSSAYEKKLIRFCQKYNLNNVVFRGVLERCEVFRLYSKSVLLFPSLLESFGMPLLEARLSGSFILAANTPFAHEVLSGYSNAYFYDGMDAKRLANLMLDIMEEKIAYKAEQSNILKQFQEEKSIIDILEEV